MHYGFVAYIDEAGDDGLKRVRPIDERGSSEWFVLAAVVVQTSNETAVGRWQREMLARLSHSQRPDIHYRDLIPAKRRVVCELLGQQPLRAFVVISNKKNIKGYRNPRCYHEKNYLYWWLTRLLLERVTRFCAKRSQRIYGEPRPIKMIFSQRGGMSYDRLVSYLRLLRLQSQTGTLFLSDGDLAWPMVDLDQIRAVAHKNEAGLQLADIVAGAFYEAVTIGEKRDCDLSRARLIIPRLYRGPGGAILGYGVKPMPQPQRMSLLPSQREIFEALGYPPDRW